MASLLGVIKVQDYAQWKAGFDCDAGKAVRKNGGMKAYRVFQAADDPNTIVIVCEFDDVATARQFVESPELAEASRQSGVTDQIAMYCMTEADQQSI